MKILIAPLDWGLGHATRCMPIIDACLRRRIEVLLAADGRSFGLLKKEYPSCELIRLPGVTVKYPDDGAMLKAMIKQLPSIARAMISEHNDATRIISSHGIDAVISDNRFGLFHRSIPSVYMTHQLTIMLPAEIRVFEPLVRFAHRMIIRRFDACWIPDAHGEPNLSGKLSHNQKIPRNAEFIGPLSRFSESPIEPEEFEVIIVLSGPEPQRTNLEKLLLQQSESTGKKTLLVRGVTEHTQKMRLSGTITVVSSLESAALAQAIRRSGILISRPGYSTIMDLTRLRKKAIFIPTPGQTEQEYLAEYFKSQNLFYSEPQDKFDLTRALAMSSGYTGFPDSYNFDNCIDDALDRLIKLIC